MGFFMITFENMPSALTDITERLARMENLLSVGLIPPKIESDLMDLRETGKFLGLTAATLYTKVSRKEIPSYKYGKMLRFSRKELTELIESNRRSTVTEIGKNAVLRAAQSMQRGNGAA